MPDSKPTPKTALTEYVILRQFLTAPPTTSIAGSQSSRASEQWDRCGTVQARSAEHAIRLYADTLGKRDDGKNIGTFVAIPARSFKPVRVTAEVQTTLTIQPA